MFTPAGTPFLPRGGSQPRPFSHVACSCHLCFQVRFWEILSCCLYSQNSNAIPPNLRALKLKTLCGGHGRSLRQGHFRFMWKLPCACWRALAYVALCGFAFIWKSAFNNDQLTVSSIFIFQPFMGTPQYSVAPRRSVNLRLKQKTIVPHEIENEYSCLKVTLWGTILQHNNTIRIFARTGLATN